MDAETQKTRKVNQKIFIDILVFSRGQTHSVCRAVGPGLHYDMPLEVQQAFVCESVHRMQESRAVF